MYKSFRQYLNETVTPSGMDGGKTMLVIMNHKLTNDQKIDAQNSLGVSNFVYGNEGPIFIKTGGATILDENSTMINDMKRKIDKLSSRDVLMIQTEAATTYHLVNYARDKGIRCYHSATKRTTSPDVHQEDGTVVKGNVTFKHIRYREYV